MRHGWIAVAVALALGRVALGGPLEPKQVAGDAQWVVHADASVMQASSVAQKAYHALVEQHPLGKIGEAILDKSRTIVGMDPRKDLHGITAYGKTIGREEGVLIIVADVDQALLAEKVQRAPDYRMTMHGPYTVVSWTHVDPRGRRPVAGAFYKSNVIVFSGSPEEVKAAIDVMDGNAPCLDAACPLAAATPAGTALVARAVRIGQARLPGNPPLLKQLDTLNVVIGEDKGTSFAHARLSVKSAEVAAHMKDVLLGARALGLLHAGDDPKEKALAEAIKVSSDSNSVSVDFEASADDVWEHVRKDIRRMLEMHKAAGGNAFWNWSAGTRLGRQRALVDSGQR